MVSQEAIINREALKSIKQLYDSGKIDRDQAKQLAEPIIRRANAKAETIAKKYNKKPYRLNFSSLMRDNY